MYTLRNAFAILKNPDVHRGIDYINLVPLNIETLEALEGFVATYRNNSRYFGGFAREVLGDCQKQSFHPPSRQHFDGDLGARNSYLMLILINAFDSVTPAVDARQMAFQYLRSVLVKRKAVGDGASETCVNGITTTISRLASSQSRVRSACLIKSLRYMQSLENVQTCPTMHTLWVRWKGSNRVKFRLTFLPHSDSETWIRTILPIFPRYHLVVMSPELLQQVRSLTCPA